MGSAKVSILVTHQADNRINGSGFTTSAIIALSPINNNMISLLISVPVLIFHLMLRHWETTWL